VASSRVNEHEQMCGPPLPDTYHEPWYSFWPMKRACRGGKRQRVAAVAKLGARGKLDLLKQIVESENSYTAPASLVAPSTRST